MRVRITIPMGRSIHQTVKQKKKVLPLSDSPDLLSDMHDIHYLLPFVHGNSYSKLSKYLCNLVIPPTEVKNNVTE